MRLYRDVLRLSCVFIAVAFSLAVGCESREPEIPDAQQGAGHESRGTEAADAQQYEALRAFVYEDVFAPSTGGVYPEPKAVPSSLLEYAAREYDSNADVRRLVACYFLRYDSVLLDHGLGTASADDSTLVGLLWSKDAKGFIETPSTELMRQHIADSIEWFCLDSPGKELLEANQAKFDNLVEAWKTHSQTE